MNHTSETATLERKLSELQATHRALDSRIQQLVLDGTVDMIEIQRLKKMKLRLKDKMTLINDQLLPDIIA